MPLPGIIMSAYLQNSLGPVEKPAEEFLNQIPQSSAALAERRSLPDLPAI